MDSLKRMLKPNPSDLTLEEIVEQIVMPERERVTKLLIDWRASRSRKPLKKRGEAKLTQKKLTKIKQLALTELAQELGVSVDKLKSITSGEKK